jgi:hypothetical protein
LRLRAEAGKGQSGGDRRHEHLDTHTFLLGWVETTWRKMCGAGYGELAFA